ncbi:ABC transporter ATP-binding protein [Roseomonas eburnea]|uniref:ABC transporter ATP-binding protein n=2 Tax=Neoroseomonas eburnea TaxID=1346889 RepID=A0A9X9X9R1_9PROT|nr:ABC transporter ATP-binding protein [Neoroseomonas eburnea]
MPHEPVLALSGVSAGYGGAAVLEHVSLVLRPGERVAVLGRNGTGKTTLVQAVFNLGPQVGGSVQVMGREVAGWPTYRIARLGIALVPQGRGAFPDLTVVENLRLATLRGRPGAWSLERVFELFPRLAERRATPSNALSGGERQMLAIGRALLTQASLLVLDEPSEGLAPSVAEEVIVNTLRSLAGEGKTVLLVEQNLSLALRSCERAVILAGGRIVFDGASSDLLAAGGMLADHLGV